MRTFFVFHLAAVGLALGGCGGDADVTASLELRVDLPAAGGTTNHALVEVEGPNVGPWDVFEAAPLPSVPLASGRSEDAVSVLTSDAALDLRVRIRFCAAAECVGEDAAPAQRFTLRGPFFVGERTLHRIFAEDPAVDVADPVEVDRCQIRGCVESDLSTYCDTMGTHLCELPHPEGPAPGAISDRVVRL